MCPWGWKRKSYLSLNSRKRNIHSSFTPLAPTVWWLLDRTTPIHCFIGNNYTKNKKARLLGKACVVCKHVLLLMCYNWIRCSQSWRKHCQSIGVFIWYPILCIAPRWPWKEETSAAEESSWRTTTWTQNSDRRKQETGQM